MTGPSEQTSADRDKFKEKLMRDLGNYEVRLKVVPTKAKDGRTLEAYIVRSCPDGQKQNVVQHFDTAMAIAVELQERKTIENPPQGFEKTFLMSMGSLRIYRTVHRKNGKLEWLYRLENSHGEVLAVSERFWDVSIHAVGLVTHEANKIAKKEASE